MAQQVVRAKMYFDVKGDNQDRPTFDTVWEQLGTNTNVNLATVSSKLQAFINSTPSGGTAPLGTYMGFSLAWSSNNVHIEMYDITAHLDGSAAGAPIDVVDWTPTVGRSAGTTSLPEQVACVFSYRSDYGSDPEFSPSHRPRATHRGRFYLGPLNQGCIDSTDANGQCEFSSSFYTNAHAALADLTSHSGTSDITGMVQWSRSQARVSQIFAIQVNTRPDIRRRRAPRSPKLVW